MLRFAPATFAVAYSISYALMFAMDWPLFVYYPQNGDFAWGRAGVGLAGPAMHWYGFMASAGLVSTLLAFLIPDRIVMRIFRLPLIVFPTATLLVCVYLLRALLFR